MLEHCLTISELVSEGKMDEVRNYCINNMPSDVDPDSESYNSIKDSAVNETEIWGEESEYWIDAVSPSAQMNESEWKFVLGNFLLSAVKDCKTNGDVFADSLICKSAHDLLNDIEFADRHQNLALALHHYKLGYMASQDDNTASAVDHYETANEIINQSDGIGGWHYESLVLRDLTITQSELYVSEDNHLDAIEDIEKAVSKMSSMNAPKTEKFVDELNSRKFEIRAEMADILGKESKKQKYINKADRLKV